VSAVHADGTKRERLAASACVAAGAGLMLLAVSRTWVHAVADDPLVGRLAVDATGRQAAPVVAAVALVALAGAVAVLTLRTIGRSVAGLLLVLAAGAAAAAALGVARTPSDALRSVLSDATGRSGGPLPVAQPTVWPWVATAGAVLVLLGAAVAVARARRWSGLSAKYDAPTRPAGVTPTRRQPPLGATDVGERGADVRGTERGATGDRAATGPPGEADHGASSSAPPDPWEQLSRGEDPTV
jgi:uncharacterized membrane protein (TIGR02234 family)